MKHPVLSFALSFMVLFWLSVAEARAQAKTVSITIPVDRAHPLKKTTFGVNALFNRGTIAYTNKDLATKYKELGSQIIRFPGGTCSNFYNFKTAYHDVPTPQVSQKHHTQMTDTNKGTRRGKSDMGGYRTEHFCEFQKRAKAEFSLVLNICTQKPQYTREWLKLFKKKRVKVNYVELGNEVYFGIYKGMIPSVEDYIQKAKAHAAVVKEIFPQAKLGVVISSHSFTSDSFVDTVEKNVRTDRNHTWDTKIAKESFYDAVVIHLYGSPGVPNSTPMAQIPPYKTLYKNCFAHVDNQFEKTMAYLSRTFPKKPVWVTEYHVGGFGGDLRKVRMRFSALGALYACNFFMTLAATPEISMGTYHSYAQMLLPPKPTKGPLASHYTKEKLTPLVNFQAYQLFREAVLGASKVVTNKLTGAGTYEGTGKHKGTYPELHSVSFLGKREAWVYVVNKFNTPYRLTQLTLGNKPCKTALSVTTMTPPADVTAEKIIITEKGRTFPIALPPYSLTRIKIRP